MSSIKLGVEVESAHDLMPKDGQGSASPYVELHFDRQEFRTTTKEKDLNPSWNETFYFNISDPNNLSNLTLDAYVYNSVEGNNPIRNPFMGKVHINGTSFVPYSDAIVSHYPLEKRSILSRVKGELGLKVFIVDNPSIRSSNPIPQTETSSHDRKERTFNHLPNPNLQQQSQVPSQQPHKAPMNQPQDPQPFEYSVKETNPSIRTSNSIGGRVVNSNNRRASRYDLVEPMSFLFVRVVKAQDLPSLDPYVEVKVGNYKGITKHFSKTSKPEWNTVFAFSKERMQASVLDIVVKDKDLTKDEFVGIVRLSIPDIPIRVPPDSSLAPQWYRLEDKKGEKKKGELMLAVWIGTQADEAFPDAFLDVDAAVSNVDSSMDTRSKVYHSPRLWYVRVNIIEVKDLVWAEKTRFPDVYVKAQINNQVSRTRPVQVRTSNALWNEEMMFVAAEPFEDRLILTIKDRGGLGNDEDLGKVFISLNSVERRADNRLIHSRWFSLQDQSDDEEIDNEKKKKKVKFTTRLHLRVCLDGGYHVFDESPQQSSDLRPIAKQLWKPPIGVLELGILNASALQPMKTRGQKGTVDAYCVARYSHKWVRTRTVVDNLAPRFNEQYTWEVYDPSTVLTVGVFDNTQLENGNSKDVRVGKIRIRISTLETGRVFTQAYPLVILHPTGAKKMGELHLALRFSTNSMKNMMLMYSKPLLPKMHYVNPLTDVHIDMLRHQAVEIVADRLGRVEPPLGREIVEYMTDANSHPHLWSMRRSKAIFFRLMLLFDWIFRVRKWFEEVCSWKSMIETVLVHILFAMFVSFPELIPPTLFLYMFLIGLWNYRFREQYYPLQMNTRLSCEGVNPDELDEEFDRLGSVSGWIQSVVGDIVSQGEQLQGLLTWRDPRATVIFLVFCFMAALVLYTTPFEVLVLLSGFYVMRHPRFRLRLPSAPLNFFRRLPVRTESLL